MLCRSSNQKISFLSLSLLAFYHTSTDSLNRKECLNLSDIENFMCTAPISLQIEPNKTTRVSPAPFLQCAVELSEERGGPACGED
jgi:hypothetical protein